MRAERFRVPSLVVLAAAAFVASSCNSPTERTGPEPEPVALVRLTVTGQLNAADPFVTTVAGTLTGDIIGPPGGRVPRYLEVRLEREGYEPRIIKTQDARGAFALTEPSDSTIAWQADFIGLPNGHWQVTAIARDGGGLSTTVHGTLTAEKPEAQYAVEPLPLPAGLKEVAVVAASEAYAIGVAGGHVSTRGILWSPAGVSVLHAPDTGNFRPTKVNRDGIAVGEWSRRVVGTHGSLTFVSAAVRWIAGRMETLGDTAGFPASAALDINDRGDVLVSAPARIFTDTGVVPVGISPGLIDENGRVVGYTGASDGGTLIGTWEPSPAAAAAGGMAPRTTSAATPPRTMYYALALNSTGSLLYAAGYTPPYHYGVRGVFDRAGATYDIPLIAAWQRYPTVIDINDEDWVVGAVGPAFFLSGDGKASRVAIPPEWRLTKVVALTNTRTIYAMAIPPSETAAVPVRLIPR